MHTHVLSTNLLLTNKIQSVIIEINIQPLLAVGTGTLPYDSDPIHLFI